MKKIVSGMILAIILISVFLSASDIKVVKTLPSSTSIPTVIVSPSLYRATHVGEVFNISINIENLNSSYRMVGTEVRLSYNNSLLEAVDAYEGSFMKQFGDTYYIKYIEDDSSYGPNVLIGILLLPNATGQWTNFPEGNGSLATITFKSIAETPSSCNLTLIETKLVSEELENIPHNVSHGFFEYLPITLLGTGWGWMQITPKKYVYGHAELYKIGENQIELAITYQGKEHSKTWNIIWHREYRNYELYYCFSPRYGFLRVLLQNARCRIWLSVGRDAIAFGFLDIQK